jgi:deoxyxylulose-5-phosphate synthase
MIEQARLTDAAYRDVAVRIIGIPAEMFVEHGSVDQLRRMLRLDAAGIADQIRETLKRLRAEPNGVASADAPPVVRSRVRRP